MAMSSPPPSGAKAAPAESLGGGDMAPDQISSRTGLDPPAAAKEVAVTSADSDCRRALAQAFLRRSALAVSLGAGGLFLLSLALDEAGGALDRAAGMEPAPAVLASRGLLQNQGAKQVR